MPTEIARDRALRALQHGFERAGWTIESVDINAAQERARVYLKRHDGLLLTFDAQGGRASTTRELVEEYEECIGPSWSRAIVRRLRTRFVGRTRHQGMRSGLRFLADYIADNSAGALTRYEARNLVRPLLALTPVTPPEEPTR